MSAKPIILVPGFWLGAWAWDEVVSILRTDGHDVTALTLPGLESVSSDRSSITVTDHIDAICSAVAAAGQPVVLGVHSGAGAPGYATTDRIPELIATMVYIDSAPATGAINPDATGTEVPVPPHEELAAEENLEGLSDEQLATFRERAVPEPAGPVREAADLANEARLDVPSTVICSAYTSAQVKAAVNEGYAWLGGLAELRNVTYVDLPTGHWPMWSRPKDLAAILAEIANG